MKALDIALRDTLRSFRSLSALAFMFMLPLLIAGIFYFAFGGASAGDEGPLPRISVIVVNQDIPTEQISAGELMLAFLQSEDLATLLDVGIANNPKTAREAVTSGEAGVAVIIPQQLSASLSEDGGSASITLLQDPTLTIGPAIVRAILSQFLDGFSGSRIAVDVAVESLTAAGVQPSPHVIGQTVAGYTSWIRNSDPSPDGAEGIYRAQPAAEGSSGNLTAGIVSSSMASMLVFYVFFTAASLAQSIIREQEEGTLQRLLTAPISAEAILAGKIIGTLLTLIVQVAVLLLVSRLLFSINWGEPLPLALAILGLIMLAASFGLFLMSLIRHSNQVSAIYNLVLNITGLFGTYAYFLPVPQSLKRLALFVPQGWAMNSWDITMHGSGVSSELLFSVGVSLALSLIFFIVGARLFRRRFAA